MSGKIICWVILSSSSLYIGCYSTGSVTKEEFRTKAEQTDITVFTKDLSQYRFAREEYRIHGDTLSGAGFRVLNTTEEKVLDASIPFADIGLIQTRQFSLGKTILLCSGAGLGAVVLIEILLPRTSPGVFVGPSYGSP